MPFSPLRLAALALACASLAACATPKYATSRDGGGRGPSEGSTRKPDIDPNLRGTMKPYQVNGVWYTPKDQPHYNETGVASWYGQQFHNRTTANGELFDMDVASAAHKTLPLPSIVEVTNLENGRKLKVRVNDRGPFVDGRIIDLSREAAAQLGFRDRGLTNVRVRYIGPAGPVERQAKAKPAPAYPVRGPTAQAAAASPAVAQPILKPMWRVQAAVFTDQDSALTLARQLGRATAEPVPRGGATSWRVMVGPAGSADEAEILREEVAGWGYPDARVINPF